MKKEKENMGLYSDTVEIPRRTMVLFFLIDTSGSMTGRKIATVNDTMRSLIPVIKKISNENADAQIKIAALDFSTGAKWMYDAPVSADDFKWTDLYAKGMTDFGKACSLLNSKLSRNEFMKEASGSYAPAIFLLSDGEPTDRYHDGLAALRENNWFKVAIKVAIAIGQNANKDVLEEFTESMETVITVHNPDELREWITFVAVRSSQIGSQSTNSGNKIGQMGEEIIKKKKEVENKTQKQESNPYPAPNPNPAPAPNPNPDPESEWLIW